MKCPYCNQDHPDDFQFCPKTGKRIENQNKACTNEQCSAYGKYVLPQDAKFCPNCGCSIVNETANVNHDTEKDKLTFSVNGGVSFSMIKVKAGYFFMGLSGGISGIMHYSKAYDLELPIHEVKLTHDYYLGEFLVTQELWKSVMSKETSYFGLGGHGSFFTQWQALPVDHVKWDDCQQFIEKLNTLFSFQLKKMGMCFRLPTEAEWEYAARGGHETKGSLLSDLFYAGSNELNKVAWCLENSRGETHPVGQKKPNALGLYDMTGNVGEWCLDSYVDYKDESQTNPVFIDERLDGVYRGGDFNSDCNDSRLSMRFQMSHKFNPMVGLRLCLSKFEIKNQSYIEIK